MQAFASFFALLLASACASLPEKPPGRPFDLRIGETVRIAGCEMTVSLVGVSNDSRCPEGVTCVWEGDAEVELEITRAGGPAERRVHRLRAQRPDEPCAVSVVDLAPAAREGESIAPSSYVASIAVSGS